MDMSKLRQRLATLQNPKGQKKELSQDIWKPTIGKHQVRIVPSAYDKQNPFKELYFHYSVGKTMLSLISYGEKDPIVEMSDNLRKTKDKWQMGLKLQPKLRVVAPVIVRGEEEKGVRLWEFGVSIYKDLLSLTEDEDIGDFTDPLSGRDIVVEVADKAVTGKDYNTSSVRVSVKVTPLSKDAAQVEQWITKQPDPMSIFTKYSYEDMLETLRKFLDVSEDTSAPANAIAETPVAGKKSYSLATPPQKAEVDDEFADLFKVD